MLMSAVFALSALFAAGAVKDDADALKWDPRFKEIKSKINADDYDWYDAARLPIEGRGYVDEQNPFVRVPPCFKDKVPSAVSGMGVNTTGLELSFVTDSPDVVLRQEVVARAWVDPFITPCGLDGCAIWACGANGEWRFLTLTRPNANGVAESQAFLKKGDLCRVYFPIRSVMKNLKIGVRRGRSFETVAHRRRVVHYGTSIVHGGCVSQSGLMWTSIYSRVLDCEVVNLGFSGWGRMELSMADFLGGIDTPLYIVDCDWNMNVPMQEKNYEPFVRRLKELRPNVPILLCGGCTEAGVSRPQEVFARGVYDKLRKEDPKKWRNLHFFSGVEQLPKCSWVTHDHCHPNDIGADYMGKAFAKRIGEVMGWKPSAPAFPPPPLQRFDFTADVRRVDVKSVGEFHGELPQGMNENAVGWSPARLTSAIERKDGIDYLALDTTSGGGQFTLPLAAAVKFPGKYRIAIEMASPDGCLPCPVRIGIRASAPSYKTYWTGTFKPNGSTDAVFSLPKLDNEDVRRGIALMIYTSYGRVLLRSLEIHSATDEDQARRIRRPDASVKEYFRIGRFASGLPADWTIGRDCADFRSGVGDPAPDAKPTLKVSSESGMQLFSPPFQTNEPKKRHRLSFRYKSRGEFKVSVLGDVVWIGRGTLTLAETKEWKRAELAFDPAAGCGAHSLRFVGKGELQLDDISVRTLENADAPAPYSAFVSLAVVPGAAGDDTRVCFADEIPRVNVAAIGADESAVLKIETEDLYGRRTTREAKPGIVEFPGMPLGQFVVRAALYKDGCRMSETAEIVLTHVKRPVHFGEDAPQSHFGGHFNPVPSMIATMKAIGVNWARFHDAATDCSGWWALEKERGKWEFPDEKIARYRERHVKIYAQLGTAPKWATYYDRLGFRHENYFTKYLRPTNAVDWVNYVKTYVGRYKDSISDYFIWNEPWGGWWERSKDVDFFGGKEKAAQEFGEFSVITYKAAKAANPAADISGINGCAGNDAWSAGVAKGGGFDACDSLDYHTYSSSLWLTSPDGTKSSDKFLEPLRKEHPDLLGKKVIMSEGQGDSDGGHTGDRRRSGLYRDTVPWKADSVSEMADSADHQVRFVMSILSEGVCRVFLYTQHGYHALGFSPSFVSLVGADGRPDSSAAAFSHMASLIEGRFFDHAEKSGARGYVWYFRGEGARRGKVGVHTGLLRDEVLSLKGKVTDLYGNRPTAETWLPGTVVYSEE